MNRVFLVGRLTRDPEMRRLASGKTVTTLSLATNEYAGNGTERQEYHNLVVWDRLAEIVGAYVAKGNTLAVEGRLQTRTWDDERGMRHWRTEVVVSSCEMVAGKYRKNYALANDEPTLVGQTSGSIE